MQDIWDTYVAQDETKNITVLKKYKARTTQKHD